MNILRLLVFLLVIMGCTSVSESTLFFRQSTASQEFPIGYMLDSTDGNTEETGLTIANTDIKIWVTGATTVANKNSGNATHIANGIYYAVLDATDTATAGSCKIFVHVSGALAREIDCAILPQNVYDSLLAGSTALTVGTIGATQTFSNTGTWTGNLSGSVGSVTIVSDKAGYALSSAGVDGVLDEVVEGTLTVRQMLTLFESVLAGRSTGFGTGSIGFLDNAAVKPRVTATIDGSGNRTAVVLDPN